MHSMKRTVVTFGLISGAVTSVMMLATIPFADSIGFEKGAIIGYTSIVLACLVVFFGIRSYRDNVGDGRLGFGRGVAVGMLITVISCSCYVVTWEFVYFKLMPGFADKYSAHMIERVRASGATPEKIEETRRQAESLKQLLDNPLTNAAIAFIEPFPIAAVATLISAAVLRKR